MTERKTWRCPRCGVDVWFDLPGRCPDKECPPVPAGELADKLAPHRRLDEVAE